MKQKISFLLTLNIIVVLLSCKKDNVPEPIARVQTLATLSTSVATSVTMATAISGGTITDDGGSQILVRGICWGNTTGPTISGNKTVNGAGTGTYSASLSGLSSTSTYFVRAYATNSTGTAYGNEISFISSGPPPPSVTVYAGGYERNGNIQTAKYWKNGVATLLTNGTFTSQVNSIFIAGNDIYAAGLELNASNKVVGKYWKNGGAVNLTDGITSAALNSIIVVGSDVYAAGYQVTSSGSNSFARYWKNGIPVTLSNGSTSAELFSIIVVGSDVYAAGQETNASGKTVAKYWKNGSAVNLTDGTKTAGALSIAVSGSDVYVSGYENNQSVTTTAVNAVARYWKNGIPVVLGGTAPDSRSSAYSLYLSGNDVYCGGFDVDNTIAGAKYWKNNTRVNLTNGLNPSSVSSIVVINNDVYAGGAESNGTNKAFARYWKNGVAVDLSDGLKYESITSLIVVP